MRKHRLFSLFFCSFCFWYYYCILVAGNSSMLLFVYFCLSVCELFGNLPIFFYQGSVIQNLAVVSCRLSVSVVQGLDLPRPGIPSGSADYVRSGPTTSAQCGFRFPHLYYLSPTLYRLSYLAPRKHRLTDLRGNNPSANKGVGFIRDTCAEQEYSIAAL